MRINQNIAAQNAYRNLTVTNGQMSKSLEKLSSGFRINRAADDAAGLAISEGLRAQVGGLKVAVRNAQDGVSVVQTAEGALTEVHALLQRTRDLAVQSASTGGNSLEARKAAATEVDQAMSEINRISQTTEFGGKRLLDGSVTGGFAFHVGAGAGPENQVNVKIDAMNVNGLKLDATQGRSVGTPVVANAAYVVATGTNDTLTLAVDGGAATNLTLSAMTSTNLSTDAGKAALLSNIQSKIDANSTLAGKVTASLSATNQLQFTSTSTGTTSTVAATGNFNTAALAPNSLGAAAGANVQTATAGADTGGSLKTRIENGDTAAITIIDKAISSVSTQRANLGAYQNRLEHTVANLSVTQENLSASESRIRDTDMAQEMVKFTRAQILTQAGTSMLAQANQAPQGVLSLLR